MKPIRILKPEDLIAERSDAPFDCHMSPEQRKDVERYEASVALTNSYTLMCGARDWWQAFALAGWLLAAAELVVLVSR